MTPSLGSTWFYPSLSLRKSLLKIDVSAAGWWGVLSNLKGS